MASSSALRSGIKNYERYLNVLSGTEPYVAPALNAYDLLATEILTGSQSSVTFSSLNSTYGADYQHLQIRVVGRTTRAAAQDAATMQFNGDTGSNYTYHALEGNGSAVSSYASAPRSNNFIAQFAGASGVADSFGVTVVDILDPFETTKYTTTRALSGLEARVSTAGRFVILYSGLWMNTAALTSITIAPGVGSLVTGSRFSLYGLRSA